MVPPNQYDLMSVLTSDRAEAGLQILLAPGPRPPQHRAPLCGARRTEEQKSHAERELPRQDHRRGWMPRARGGDRAAVGGLDGMMGQVPSWRRAPSGPPRRRTAASHRSPDKARPQEHSDVGAGSFSTEGKFSNTPHRLLARGADAMEGPPWGCLRMAGGTGRQRNSREPGSGMAKIQVRKVERMRWPRGGSLDAESPRIVTWVLKSSGRRGTPGVTGCQQLG
ncbi:uncharacterized protein LOC124522542 isoform X1 [Lynx rufus]|uniref:uncharacterized protein LOC124522542 isoform X1 n=1 Tax=Lynx rufus TaxID=61384 RepID=UPI001F124624|nr:uncharacterized protein LOC124522542 isoform X1 [Lynx rufus]